MNSRFGRTPRVPWQPMYARFLAPFCRSAKGRYPPNCDMHSAIRNVRFTSIRDLAQTSQMRK